MKNFIFFLLLVGVLGCESKSKLSVKEEGGYKDKLESSKANLYNDKFNKIVNRIEYEIIKVLLKNGKSEKKSKDFNNQIDEDIKKFVEKLPDTDSTSWDRNNVKMVFDQIAEDGKYEPTRESVNSLEELKNKISKPMNQDKDLLIKYLVFPAKPYKNKKPQGQDSFLIMNKDTLNKKIIDFIHGNSNDSETYKTTMKNFIETIYKDLPSKPTPIKPIPLKEPENSFWEKFLYFVILLSFLAIYFLYEKNKKLKSENKFLLEKNHEFLDNVKSQLDNEGVGTIEATSENDNMNNVSPVVVIPDPYQGNNVEENKIKSNEIVKENSIKYAGRPSEDGSFSELGDKFIAGKSLYCLDISVDKAIFWVEDDPSVFALLQVYPDSLLRPVCIEMNSHNFIHKHITTELNGEGQAQWDEEKQVWKVTQKAKIKYS